MAAVSELEEPEPPEEKRNAAAVLALSPPVPWLAAVAERYERHEKLGEGMFGDVYKAWDRVLERFVAVKRLSGRTDDRFVTAPLRDFAREVMSLAACRGHPSVVQLLATYADRGRADGDCFVVTEYAGPMNLRQYVDIRRLNGQPFDEDEVRDVMEQLLAGARHAHMAGVLHRDIVPENVMVDMDAASGRMVYKICGFGMSKPAAQADKDDSGLLASSSPYRAPELFLGSKDYAGR
jgi:cell division cycle 2-like protein